MEIFDMVVKSALINIQIASAILVMYLLQCMMPCCDSNVHVDINVIIMQLKITVWFVACITFSSMPTLKQISEVDHITYILI